MGLAYCPIDQDEWAPRPPIYRNLPPIRKPVVDDTECNYIIMGFIGSIFLLGIMDSLRK
jgi:hypothetical protein